MPIETIEFNGQVYPKFQSTGNAAKYVREFALEVCKGNGLDIGYNREGWKFPGAFGVDENDGKGYDAYNLPPGKWDYIHASHVIEHLTEWVRAIRIWEDSLLSGGVLFLYVPDYSQHYWRVWNNLKHKQTFTPNIIRDYLIERGTFKNIFVSGIDIYNSFVAIAEKI